MKANLLLEAINLYQDGKYKYANIDAKDIYANCVNKDMGSHTFEEAKQFKDYVGINENTTPEELHAIRNTLVKYWSDHLRDEGVDTFKMGDQMQFYTCVIDMMLDNLENNEQQEETAAKEEELDEGFLPTYEELGTIIETKNGFNLLDPNSKQKMLIKDIPSLKDLLNKLAENL